MSVEDENVDPREEELNALIAEYMLLVDRGVPVDEQAFAAEHPKFAAELQAFFSNVQLVQGAVASQQLSEASPADPELDPEITEAIPAPRAPAAQSPQVHASPDHNLLFGILALELDFVTRDQLVLAMQAWRREEPRSLGAILVRQGALTESRRGLLDQLVREHVDQHGHDVHKSLVAVGTRGQLDQRLTGEYARELWTTLGGPQPGLASSPTDPASAAAEPPRALGGRFRIMEFLAKGGLGQVLLAEDAELGRTVAIKEIRPAYADDATCRQRFTLEAEITGGLEHPGIVPVYGRGSYPDGRPYYAMRLIRGDNLRAAIDAFHRQVGQVPSSRWPMVELHQLLRRFIDVCQAVQYAHSRGVIHRDLKPANVMLGKFGETLVVDWGLAKVVGRGDADPNAEEQTLYVRSGSGTCATELGSTVGTPAFMSPEQAAGAHGQAGPTSDVYSLGATLYYLLTGRPPFTDPLRDVILDKVRRGDFPRPRQVNAAAPPALEAICLKAMALQPADRYPTPAGLIADLEHWIADEPVAAYAETRSERLARWMRRHRTGVQAGAVILLAVAVVLSGATFLVTRAWRSETRSKEQALQQFVQARDAVDKWLTGAGHALGYYPGSQRPRERLLEQAARDYEQLVREHSDDPALELERGRTYLRLGHLRRAMQNQQGAATAYQAAQKVFEGLAQQDSNEIVYQVELASCQTDLGLVAAAGKAWDQAHAAYQAAVDRLETVLRRSPDAVPPRAALATTMLNRGELQFQGKAFDTAERDLRRSIKLASQLVTENPQAAGPLSTLATARELLGRVLLDRGQYPEGVQELQAAVEASTRRVNEEPGEPAHLESRAAARLALAHGLQILGRSDEELNAYRQALEDFDTLTEVLPGVEQFVESQAITRINLAGRAYQIGQLTLAESELTAAQEALKELIFRNPDTPQYVHMWASCRDIQGEVLRDRGQPEEAQVAVRDAIKTYQRLIEFSETQSPGVPPEYRESLAICHSHLAQTLHLLGQADPADQEFRTAIEMLRALADSSPLTRDRMAFVHHYRGAMFASLGQPDRAAREFGAAQQIWTTLAAAAAAAPEHRQHLAWLLANCPQANLREPEKAASLAERLTTELPDNASYWQCLGVALYRTEKNGKLAVDALEQAQRLRKPDDGRDWLFLALARWQIGDQNGAREAYQRGAKWLVETMPGNAEAVQLQREAARLIGEEISEDREP